MIIKFDDWKAEYEPRYYEDSGAECFDHDKCDCVFLLTYGLEELADEDEEFLESYPELALSVAIKENRVWSWGNDGGIRSGITTPRSELLVTERAWTEETEVDTNG
jgi:hypothetical protein